MIRVCHITSVHHRYDGRIYQKECQALADAGFQVILLVNDGKCTEQKKNLTIQSCCYIKNRYLQIILASLNMYLPALQINAQIYHLHDPELLPLALWLKRKHKKVIFDSHEFYYYQIKQKAYIPALLRGVVANIYKRYEYRVLSHIDAVITPCTINGKNYFEGISQKTIFVNNIPFKDEIIPYPYAKKNNIKSCYLGGLARARGIEQMIKASYKAEIPSILGGTYEAGVLENLQRSLEYEIVTYMGILSRKEVQSVYNEASIGLSVLQNTGQYAQLDNLPTKVYEYMAAGLPVVLSRFAYTERFLQKYPIGILVNPNDTDEITEALSYLATHPHEAEKMGRVGRQTIENELCWEREKEMRLMLYCEMFYSDAGGLLQNMEKRKR